MRKQLAAAVVMLAAAGFCALAEELFPQPPKAGKVEIFKSSDLRPGMKGIAWTVFQGTEAEPIPIEIIGLWKNAWGPKQDIILAKMGGKAQRTNVAGGMSGSPVYIDGKLIGAVALRLSVFSPDAICGITPIELMLEINDFDQVAAHRMRARRIKRGAREEVSRAQRIAGAGRGGRRVAQSAARSSADDAHRNAAAFSPASTRTCSQEFGPLFQQLGITAVQGGGERRHLHHQARRRLEAFAEAGRRRRGRAGIRRHERHRPRHRHL